MIIIDRHSILDSSQNFLEGRIILVDKPLEWTSFDVVNKIRYKLKHYHNIKKIKVGHNGTLDPLATGLLMIFTGKYTKMIPSMENHDKSYTAHIKFGAETASFDRETEEIRHSRTEHITQDKIIKTLESFMGEQLQEVPAYSANKQDGVAMYKLARQGKAISRKTKTVFFHKLKLLDIDMPFCTIEVECSKGTYIRALARDLGRKMNSAAYLYGLTRTAIDDYQLDDAIALDDFCNKIESSEYSNQ